MNVLKLSNLKPMEDAFNRGLSELNEKTKSTEQHIQFLLSSYDAAVRSKNDIEANIREREADFDRLCDDITQCKAAIDEYNKTIEKEQAKATYLEKLKREHYDVQDKITEAEEQFAELKSKLKSCSDELDYKERQLRALQQDDGMDEERLEAKLREREKKIKMLENAIEDVKAGRQNSDVKRQLREAQARVAALEKMVEVVKQALMDPDSEDDELHHDAASDSSDSCAGLVTHRRRGQKRRTGQPSAGNKKQHVHFADESFTQRRSTRLKTRYS
eukprot:m.52438 g.52438  ORF g.52438 m.52438 type:complete len:274 (+) comp10791_c0_seq1:155-976(+)